MKISGVVAPLVEVLRDFVLPLVIVGVLYHFVMKLPMPAIIRDIVNVVLLFTIIIWLFNLIT